MIGLRKGAVQRRITRARIYVVGKGLRACIRSPEHYTRQGMSRSNHYSMFFCKKLYGYEGLSGFEFGVCCSDRRVYGLDFIPDTVIKVEDGTTDTRCESSLPHTSYGRIWQRETELIAKLLYANGII